MTKTHAVRTLEKKRADLKADLAHLQMMRERTLAGLAHITATLALFRDAKKRGAPSGYQRRWLFKRGELKRLILSVEREAAGPLTHRQMAAAIVAQLFWNCDDRELVALVAEKVKGSRRWMRKTRKELGRADETKLLEVGEVTRSNGNC